MSEHIARIVKREDEDMSTMGMDGRTFDEPPKVKPQRAIEIVAQQIISAACDDSAIGVEWENYPEIGEDDWHAILVQIELVTTPPASTDYHAAYELLESRAEHE